MKKNIAMLLAFSSLAACDNNTVSKASANEQPAPEAIAHQVMLQCDGESAEIWNTVGGQEPPRVQKESRTYRIDESAKTVEVWRENRDVFEDLCSGKCGLITTDKSFSYHSIPSEDSDKGITGPPILKIKIDRVSGQLSETTEKLAILTDMGIHIRTGFAGELSEDNCAGRNNSQVLRSKGRASGGPCWHAPGFQWSGRFPSG